MSISAGQVVLHEASTGNCLQLPFSRVPELVRRCVMNKHRKPKRPWHLHFRPPPPRWERAEQHSGRLLEQRRRATGSRGPRRPCPGVRMLRNVVFRTEQVGHLIASLPRRCLL